MGQRKHSEAVIELVPKCHSSPNARLCSCQHCLSAVTISCY